MPKHKHNDLMPNHHKPSNTRKSCKTLKPGCFKSLNVEGEIIADSLVIAGTKYPPMVQGATLEQENAINLNTAKTGITTDQSGAIVLNAAKVGITSAQASAITDNTAKVVITAVQASAITDNTLKVGYTEALVSANTDVAANTLKVGNGPVFTSPDTFQVNTGIANIGFVTTNSEETTSFSISGSELQINQDTGELCFLYREQMGKLIHNAMVTASNSNGSSVQYITVKVVKDNNVWVQTDQGVGFITNDGSEYNFAYETTSGDSTWPYNSEEQGYDNEHARVNANGELEITLTKEENEEGSFLYKSSRLIMTDKKDNLKLESKTQISVEFEGKMPYAYDSEGNRLDSFPLWPAFWMMGITNEGDFGTWPKCAEVDVLEWTPRNGVSNYSNAIHWDVGSQSPPVEDFEAFTVTGSDDLRENFHKYKTIISRGSDNSGKIQMYFDGDLVTTYDITGDEKTEFFRVLDSDGNVEVSDNKHYGLLMNMALGGNYGGTLDTINTFAMGKPAGAVLTIRSLLIEKNNYEDPPTPTSGPTNSPAAPTRLVADVISIYSDAYNTNIATNYNPDWGQSGTVNTAHNPGDGKNVMVYSNFNYQGTDFTTTDLTEMEYLHIDIWVEDESVRSIKVTPVDTDSREFLVTVPVTSGAWNSVDILLTDFTDFTDLTFESVHQLKFDGQFAADGTTDDYSVRSDVYLDNIYFYKLPTTSGGGELVTNGDFQDGITGWTSGAAVAANITSYFAVAETTSGNVYDVNLSQIMAIVPDSAYTITFKAKSSIERTIIAGVGLNSGDYANSAESVSLTTEWQTFTLSQTSAGFGDDSSRVLFDMGGDQGGQVWLDDVSVTTADGTELVTNGNFQAGITGWSSGAAVAANITSYFAVIETTSAQVYEVNLSQIMTIVPDTAYTITFKAKSSIERTIIAGIGLNSGDYANSAESVSLTTEWQTFTLSQTSTGFGDDNSRVLFDMGGDQGGQVWIDDVSVIKQ
jgi:hypothetical protein